MGHYIRRTYQCAQVERENVAEREGERERERNVYADIYAIVDAFI